MNNNALYKTFTDSITGVNYLLVENGLKSSLWNTDEFSSNDLQQEVENWLGAPKLNDEQPLDYIKEYMDEAYD